MATAATFEEPKGNPLIRWAIIAVSVIVALAVLWYLYTAFTSVSGVKVDEPPPQAIDMLPPPPPPPPPPPKPQEKPPEPTDSPKPTPEPAAPKPDAPAPMTMNAEAQAGASGGIAAGSGGGMGAPSSTGTCLGPNCGGGISDGFYARSLAGALQRRVQSDGKLSRMVFSADFAIWVSPGGKVTRADLVRSSGDDRRDATLKSLLEGVAGLDAPPASFKFPRRITIRGRRSL